MIMIMINMLLLMVMMNRLVMEVDGMMINMMHMRILRMVVWMRDMLIEVSQMMMMMVVVGTGDVDDDDGEDDEDEPQG